MKRFLNILLVILLFCNINSFAQQQYPVKVEASVSMPSVFLSDYINPYNLRVKITLRDLQHREYKLKLKVIITGKNLNITSGTALELTVRSGEVYFLDETDLEILFAPTNLIFSTGSYVSALEEGPYVISFEAVDAINTTVVVSNYKTDFVQCVVMQLQPPMLSLPTNGTILNEGIVSTMFSWSPVLVISVPGQEIKYKLKIVEVVPVERNPDEAILSNVTYSNSDAFKDLAFTTFNYDNTFSAFEVGGVYAWQVQAYEIINGTETSARFKNDGKSEVFTFKVKEKCDPIIPLAVPKIEYDANNKPLVTIDWNDDISFTHTEYEIKYRPYGTFDQWAVIRLNAPKDDYTFDITQLSENVTYEYTISVKCSNWQDEVYGETFKTGTQGCSAPLPIRIAVNNSEKVELTWSQNSLAQTYSVYASKTGNLESVTPTVVTGNSTVLAPLLQDESYTVRIDAQCGSETGKGVPITVNVGQTGTAGSCVLPKYRPLSVSRPVSPVHALDISAVWLETNTIYEKYVIKYWHKDSITSARTVTVTQPTAILSYIKDNELYAYEISYYCDAKTYVTSKVSMFRYEPSSELDPGIIPGTANCFPPAEISTEVRDATSANFEWKKVSQANEYQLFYWPLDKQEFKTFTTTSDNAKIKDLLDPSKKYEYYIRCRCGSEYSVFSEIGSLDLNNLTTNEACDSINTVKIKAVTGSEIQLEWTYEADRTGYTIYYKEDSQDWSKMYTLDLKNMKDLTQNHLSEDNTMFEYTIDQLNSGVLYQFKVVAWCGTEKAQANTTVSATTVANPNRGNCESGKSCDRSSTVPVDESLMVEGTEIYIADYSMKLETVTSSINAEGKKVYSGTAAAKAPFIGYSEHIVMNTDFKNMFVNDSLCVLSGDIVLGEIRTNIVNEDLRNKIKDFVTDVQDVIAVASDINKQIQDGIDQAQDATGKALDYFQGGNDVGKVKTGNYRRKLLFRAMFLRVQFR
ncbi:MAG: fibronectin type III domain-containing protein [Bacteroidales bacterium]|nr:fibronectin type III domain-containing protein [Bacteroidales bacterium]